MSFTYEAMLVLIGLLIPTGALIVWMDRPDRRRSDENVFTGAGGARLGPAYALRTGGNAGDNPAGAQEIAHEDEVLTAIRDAVAARGIATLSQETGLPRANIAEALTPDGQPRYETVVAIVHALGLELRVESVGLGRSAIDTS